MKKILTISAIIFSLITVALAQSPYPKAPSCTAEKYPYLYEDYAQGKKISEDTVITYVVMTVPLANVTKIGDKTYKVIHPIYQNECVESASIVYDNDGMDSFNKVWDKAQSKPSLIKDMDIDIRFEYINSVYTGNVIIYTFSYPNNF